MILSLVGAAWAAGSAADCALTETDYYRLHDELQDLRRAQRGSLGVVAATPRCRLALEAVRENDPFLAVHETNGPNVDERCVAVLTPAEDGYDVALRGDCERAERVPAPEHTVTFAPWLPYGVGGRYNRDVGNGVSVLADFAWHPPRLWKDGLDLGPKVGPEAADSSSMRGLVGVDFTKAGLAGTYFGVRSGVEAATPVAGPEARYGIVSFVGGRKWMADGLALQAGGGVWCEVPLGLGPQPEILSPVAELRVGFASRR